MSLTRYAAIENAMNSLLFLQDPSNLEAKLQHHQAFEAEVQANKHRVETATSNGQELMTQKHFASDKIRQIIPLAICAIH